MSSLGFSFTDSVHVGGLSLNRADDSAFPATGGASFSCSWCDGLGYIEDTESCRWECFCRDVSSVADIDYRPLPGGV